jgi:arsenate reductase
MSTREFLTSMIAIVTILAIITRIRPRQRVAVIGSLIIFGAAVVVSMALTQQPRSTATAPSQKQPTVLFICPHGAGKSVLASAYFQKAAQERGLNVRVETAGVEPQDAVSPAVKAHLERNGYTIPVAKPRAVTKADLTQADVVISLGCDLSQLPATPRVLQKWDEVPGPSEDLKGADEQIRRRVMALVEELVARQKK